jgi:NADPH:quinone reductase-like Zn-dependent oxidoreductase
VQIGRHLGAEVTGVASAANLDLVTARGADHVIDYRSADPIAPGQQYEVVLDPGGATTFARARAALTAKGRFVPLNIGLGEVVQSLATALRGGQRVAIGVSKDTRADMEEIAALLGRGDLNPVIDRRYPLAQIEEAHRYVESRHRRGSVVLTIAPSVTSAAPASPEAVEA